MADQSYEWDEGKRQKNIESHGLDFASAPHLFSGNHVRNRARDGRGGEERWLAIGIVHGVYVTAIYTIRGGTVRMISLRRARDDERKYHQEVFD